MVLWRCLFFWVSAMVLSKWFCGAVCLPGCLLWFSPNGFCGAVCLPGCLLWFSLNSSVELYVYFGVSPNGSVALSVFLGVCYSSLQMVQWSCLFTWVSAIVLSKWFCGAVCAPGYLLWFSPLQMVLWSCLCTWVSVMFLSKWFCGAVCLPCLLWLSPESVVMKHPSKKV
jgi:hypothetical protein